ncbi:MAG TPA: hypothetical protein VGM98_05670 [Schlesneria sp.]|jgi:hypothetical protein
MVRAPWQNREAILELMEMAIEEISLKRKVTVRILTSTFPWVVYGPPAADRIVDFLKLGGVVRLLVWNTHVGASESLCKTFEKIAPAQFAVRFSNTHENGEKLNHVFVVGNQGYRVEAPHPVLFEEDVAEYYPEVPARVCFNDVKGAKALSASFDSIWDRFA